MAGPARPDTAAKDKTGAPLLSNCLRFNGLLLCVMCAMVSSRVMVCGAHAGWSGGESDAGSPIGGQIAQYLGNRRDVRGLEIAQRPTDRTAVEAAQVHGGLGRLRLT